jgi:hypothetical protein
MRFARGKVKRKSLSVPLEPARSLPHLCDERAHAYRPLTLLHQSGDSHIWSTFRPLNDLFQTPSSTRAGGQVAAFSVLLPLLPNVGKG